MNVAWAAATSLDGRRYAIELTASAEDPSGRAPGSDMIVFAQEMGDCEQAAKAYGYRKGSYTMTVVQGELSVTFTMTSSKHGELTLKGPIKDKAITGTRAWWKPGKGTISHNFSGKPQ
jgi:hypothetical protein